MLQLQLELIRHFRFEINKCSVETVELVLGIIGIQADVIILIEINANI